MGILNVCSNFKTNILEVNNMKEILKVLEDEINFYSRKLDYFSHIEKNETKMDFYCHVQTNLYTIQNILKYKKRADVSDLKVRLENYFKIIESENTDDFIKESSELENYLKKFE